MARRGVAGEGPPSAPQRPSDSVLQALWSAAPKPDSLFVLKPDISICCQHMMYELTPSTAQAAVQVWPASRHSASMAML